MTYLLYCAVNAAGVPYDRTFRPTEDAAMGAHIWTENHLGNSSIPHEYMEELWKRLQANGDRVVKVRVTTSETVTVEEV